MKNANIKVKILNGDFKGKSGTIKVLSNEGNLCIIHLDGNYPYDVMVLTKDTQPLVFN